MRWSLSDAQQRPKVRVLCLPDIDQAIGGVKQLHRHVEHLCALGWDAAMVSEQKGFRPSWFKSTAPSLSLSECHGRGELSADTCVLLLPETYLGVDLHNFRGLDLSTMARVVFNQNAYYSYGQFGVQTAAQLKEFYEAPELLQVLSVSEDTHGFLNTNLGLADSQLSRIVNAIEPIFQCDEHKYDRMHWMPRKNAGHVEAVLQGLQKCKLMQSESWQGEPLHNLSHAEVAKRLNGARMFLAFGHPEGFGLPIAEAMAAGCWVVGYSGGGGRELFRLGASRQVNFGDWEDFVCGIKEALERFSLAPRETELRLFRQAKAIQTLYSAEEEQLSIATAWDRIAKSFIQLKGSRT